MFKVGDVFEIDMFKNKLTINSELIKHDVSFNCNYNSQTILEIIRHEVLNAECHNESMKSEEDKNVKISLPIKESYIVKTDKHDIISIGFYRK